jgi:hypothetical protein
VDLCVVGTAADDPAIAITCRPSRAVGGGPVILFVIAILDPFPDIAVHVIEAEAIRLFLPDRV